jgi:hypothetical protein
MSIKYWEFEDAPLKEKLKNPSIKEIVHIYFDNETKAYRFAKVLSEVKRIGRLRLRDCGKELPVATWKRYLDFGVNVGILKHESNEYSFTDRYSKPLKNMATYIKAWIESENNDDVNVLFANARTERQKKRGGKIVSEEERPARRVGAVGEFAESNDDAAIYPEGDSAA